MIEEIFIHNGEEFKIYGSDLMWYSFVYPNGEESGESFTYLCEVKDFIKSNGKRQQPIPLPVSFVEWISDEGYMRLAREHGHKWFKLGDPASLTTQELYEKFLEDVKDKND